MAGYPRRQESAGDFPALYAPGQSASHHTDPSASFSTQPPSYTFHSGGGPSSSSASPFGAAPIFEEPADSNLGSPLGADLNRNPTVSTIWPHDSVSAVGSRPASPSGRRQQDGRYPGEAALPMLPSLPTKSVATPTPMPAPGALSRGVLATGNMDLHAVSPVDTNEETIYSHPSASSPSKYDPSPIEERALPPALPSKSPMRSVPGAYYDPFAVPTPGGGADGHVGGHAQFSSFGTEDTPRPYASEEFAMHDLPGGAGMDASHLSHERGPTTSTGHVPLVGAAAEMATDGGGAGEQRLPYEELSYADGPRDSFDSHGHPAGGTGADPFPLTSEYAKRDAERYADEEGGLTSSGLLGKFGLGGGAAAAGAGRWMGVRDGSMEQQIERRRRGIGRQRWPIVSWVVSVALVIAFIIELVKSNAESGQAIATKPVFNPMIGPTSEMLINLGARFTPCMRNTPSVPPSTNFPCLNQTSTTSPVLCSLEEICGNGGFKNGVPDQGWRFVVPIFLHAGFIHILLNLVVQLLLCTAVERLIGSPSFLIIYFAAGIGGFLLGGNFSLVAQPAVGASGAIYSSISVELVDLCYNWKWEQRAPTKLFWSIVISLLGLALGLFPGLDNFSHIGGFAVGLLLGAVLCPSIHPSRNHHITISVIRLVALALTIAFFVSLAKNFYDTANPADACRWCRYLSCLPVFSQCKGNGLT